MGKKLGPLESTDSQSGHLFESELKMSRIILISSFVVSLAACGTQDTFDIGRMGKTVVTKERLACANLGIDPGSPVFRDCVADLHHSLWAVENFYQVCEEPEGCDK
jgi:hypothetical protein